MTYFTIFSILFFISFFFDDYLSLFQWGFLTLWWRKHFCGLSICVLPHLIYSVSFRTKWNENVYWKCCMHIQYMMLCQSQRHQRNIHTNRCRIQFFTIIACNMLPWFRELLRIIQKLPTCANNMKRRGKQKET